MQKRGLSNVVTTVLIIMLALGAIILLWVFVKPLIIDNSIDISGLLTVSMAFVPDSVSIISNGDIAFLVKRNAGEGNVVGLAIILEDSKSNVKTVYKRNLTINEYEKRNVNILGSEYDIQNITKISFAPIFLNRKGKEVIGNIMDVYPVSLFSCNEDKDGDKYGSNNMILIASTNKTCPNGYTNRNYPLDCNDVNKYINPRASEMPWDGVDNDCDGAEEIDSCGKIQMPGVYHLSQDITDNKVVNTENLGGCIIIASDDVVLDCKNHEIKNIQQEIAGIYSDKTTNISVKNCEITMNNMWGTGIKFENIAQSKNSLIENNILTENYEAIVLKNSGNITIKGNKLSFNKGYGIYSEAVFNNLIENNSIYNNSWGISLLGSNDNKIQNNKICKSYRFDFVCDTGAGTTLANPSDKNSGTENMFKFLIRCNLRWPEENKDYHNCTDVQAPVCGNGICGAGEKEISCPSDCKLKQALVPGDVNLECKVNVLDLIIIRNQLNKRASDNPQSLLSDLDSSGRIDINDLIPVRSHLNTNCSAGTICSGCKPGETPPCNQCDISIAADSCAGKCY
mgnify:CR=1 FL=1